MGSVTRDYDRIANHFEDHQRQTPQLESINLINNCNEDPSETLWSDLAKLMLEMRTRHNVSHAALNCLCKGFINLLAKIFENGCFSNDLIDSTMSCFESMLTQFKRENNFKKIFNYIKPLELAVKPSQICISVANKKPRLIKHSFHYIPIKNTLTTLFSIVNFEKFFILRLQVNILRTGS